MDWPVTRSYCRAFAAAFRLPIFFSWKVGGFEREMCRNNARTAPTRFETLNGVLEVGGTGGKLGTRELFPQVSPDLKVRWCSSYLKIDVCAAAIRNDPRFTCSTVLVVSGERAEESPSRAKYQTFEVDRADARGPVHRRHVDRWRPVHAWTEGDVWATLERHRVTPHPAYRLGWGRVSCSACIFGNPDQWRRSAS
jgi:3'-phosphoadenosine 5'-phosphosulfate sulfotransferase (PAPS reductase)/FAD synthetase